jgi:aspartokinase-like uncharacterized kinase
MRGRRRLPRVVVKLGGSLAEDPSLARWLHALVSSASARFALVPGGGPFADAVRRAQRTWRFGDEAAHAMAIGAMEQSALMLQAIEPALVPCPTLGRIRKAWAGGRVALWLPQRLMRDDGRLARSWDVTSDTIAAWLAQSIGADGLLLVKSCPLPEAPGDAAGLAAAGIVDPALPGFLSNCAFTFGIAHRDQWNEFSEVLAKLVNWGADKASRIPSLPD